LDAEELREQHAPDFSFFYCFSSNDFARASGNRWALEEA